MGFISNILAGYIYWRSGIN